MPSKYIELKSYQNLGSTPAFTCLCRTVQSDHIARKKEKLQVNILMTQNT